VIDTENRVFQHNPPNGGVHDRDPRRSLYVDSGHRGGTQFSRLPTRSQSTDNGPPAPIRAAGGPLGSVIVDFSVEIAAGAHLRANTFTSATISFAAIVQGFFARPPGLPETPGL
jgi:hypothetical protein